ncbi:hypothetical protein BDY24DRAFT_380761 [Mrakia frigida]|uniref:uncharacterized protein n=1 Tax=Mrakia frigida TaxID=29902 RepID=UPI003FCC194A
MEIPRLPLKAGSTSLIGFEIDSTSSVTPFSFSDVKTTDNEELASPFVDGSKVGRIEVKLCRVEMSGVAQHTEFRQPKDTALHEVAVKKNKISHSTTYGETIPIVPQRKVEFHYEDLTASPYVEFVFLYRSKDVLKAMGAYGDDKSASPDNLRIDNKPLPVPPLVPGMPTQAGPSRHQPRLSAPSPSVRGSAPPRPRPLRRSQSPIDVDADVKPRSKRPRHGDQIDLVTEEEQEEEEVKNELELEGMDPEDQEVAELEVSRSSRG